MIGWWEDALAISRYPAEMVKLFPLVGEFTMSKNHPLKTVTSLKGKVGRVLEDFSGSRGTTEQ